MTITKLCEILKSELLNNGYEYGFIAEGKKYKPDMGNGFDKEYYQHSLTIYRVQDPLVTMKEKIGTCVDAVLVMKHILDMHGISGRIWLLYNKGKNKVHTVLTFEAESKVVYLELTPQSGKACYGKELVYEDEQMFLQELEKQNYEVSDVTAFVRIGEQPEFLLDKLK